MNGQDADTCNIDDGSLVTAYKVNYNLEIPYIISKMA